ncbi:MAG TPA: CRISPR-associated primase-polymerase type A1, partial [Candidatus Methylomirabilis sp.]|nr:CRISPR-associated primase-polymerase type A1 [Candidatus Methylomirabilis sp.]
MTPEVFRLQWQNDAASRVRLTRLLQEQIDLTEGHSAWGGFCEEVGEDELALREYRLTLRDHPDDVEALSRLAALLPEIGQMEEAGRCIEKWFQAMPGSAEALEAMVGFLLETDLPERALEVLERAAGAGQRLSVLDPLRARIRAHQKAGEWEPSEPPPPPGALNDSDVVRFAHLFSGREKLYARQWWDESGQGGYTPVQQPFTFAVARNHLLGSVTVGVYPVRLDSTVNFVAFDIDINKRALERARGDLEETRRLKELIRREAARLIEALREIGMTPILEDSGYKGRHIWLFLESPVEAAVARQFGMIFMTVHPLQARELHTEFFPKQAEVGTGVGNLIKLPLGIHRRSGRRSRLLLADGSVDHEPHESLRRVTRLSHQLLFEAITRLKERAPALPSPQGVEQPESEETVGLPSPPELPPAWTSAHFETDPEVSQLLAHCAVLRDLKNQVEGTRRLSYDEQVVLAHSLG